MGLLKKNKKPVVREYVCPSEGCTFPANDSASLQRHIEWKHPELAANTPASEKVN
jgi:hypothetical protein